MTAFWFLNIYRKSSVVRITARNSTAHQCRVTVVIEMSQTSTFCAPM